MHLTYEQRYTISTMLNQGYKQVDIARTINKDPSVVSREISRNKDQRSGEYRAELAQRKYRTRQNKKPRKIWFTDQIQRHTEKLLKQDYSPQQVVGSLMKNKQPTVSVERIYQHVWDDKKRGGTLYQHLRHKGKRYRKRGSAKDSRGIIPNKRGIEERPEIVEQRSRFGDLEGDLIIGKNHQQAIVTINDRASGSLKMVKVPSKEQKVVTEAVIDLLEDWKPFVKTLTFDNGKEFAGHETISEALDIDVYFARPYHSWERGSNENLNGLIRQYFPKSCDFTTITTEQVKAIEQKLNTRPRKRHNYENPIFVMNQLLFNPKVAFVG